MGLANGVHHLAICTRDIKKQIEFFTEVVGAELEALYWMHGVKNTFHGFLKLSDSSSVAFVQGPEVSEIQPVKGLSHAASHAAPVAPGTVQHIALNVDSETQAAVEKRIAASGMKEPQTFVLEHGYCRSVYVTDPNGLIVELTRDAPNVEKINSDRLADARSELKRWLAGDHHSNNNYR